MTKRVPLIAGNWKMFHGGRTGCDLAIDIMRGLRSADLPAGTADVVMAPPYTALAAVAADSEEIESTLKASNAEIVHSSLSRIEANGAWRLVLDVRPEGDSPAEFSAFLSHRGTRISETWLYQWRPQDDRRS